MFCKAPPWFQPIINTLSLLLLQNPVSKFLLNYLGLILVLIFDKIFLLIVFYEFYEAWESWHTTSTKAYDVRYFWWTILGSNANTGEKIGPEFYETYFVQNTSAYNFDHFSYSCTCENGIEVQMCDVESSQGVSDDLSTRVVEWDVANDIATIKFIAFFPGTIACAIWLIFSVLRTFTSIHTYPSAGWYIHLSRVKKVKPLRRAIQFFLCVQIVMWMGMAGNWYNWSYNYTDAFDFTDYNGNVRSDPGNKEDWLQRAEAISSPSFLFRQLILSMVMFDLLSPLDEEVALLNLEKSSKEMRDLHCSWLSNGIPNSADQIKELLEDAALHIVLSQHTILDKGLDLDDSDNMVSLKESLGLEGASTFARIILEKVRDGYEDDDRNYLGTEERKREEEIHSPFNERKTNRLCG